MPNTLAITLLLDVCPLADLFAPKPLLFQWFLETVRNPCLLIDLERAEARAQAVQARAAEAKAEARAEAEEARAEARAEAEEAQILRSDPQILSSDPQIL